MGLPEVVGTELSIKVPILKMSGNLSNDPRLYNHMNITFTD